MGIFSMFFACSKKEEPEVVQGDFSEYLDKNFFKYTTDLSQSMLLCYLEGDEWIWANKRFLQSMSYHDIKDFQREHESVREIFLNESEEIFTESDKSWLDYIRKYKKDGYRVTIAKEGSDVVVIDAYVHKYPKNKSLYILELRDVTQLHQAKLQTQEVHKLKSKFLANIGHEFRTPMNGILGFLELLNETDLNEKQREYIEMISKSSKGLLNNIETLLDLAQLQSHRLELFEEPFNLLPKMEKIAFHCYQLGKEKGVDVLSFIDPKIPKVLEGDIHRISQVVAALSQNAIKFTPRGGKVILEVKVLKRLQNGDCSIGFSIKDNGKGISPEQMDFIQEPFSAGNHADERMGVGLSLSFGLVELMGSELRITSQEDKGTQVNFVLQFKNAQGNNFKMVPKRKVKVVLLDQKRIDEANFLTIYLRSFAIDVIKANMVDDTLYDNAEAIYIVANQNDSSWMMELGTYHKKTPVIMLLKEEESLAPKLSHLIDTVIHTPLLPSNMAQHLYALHTYELPPVQEKLLIKDRVKALVVEDNMINQRLIQILLQSYGIFVEIASNGIEAVQKVQKKRYDIVFMDIDMPQMNGIVATKEIKSRLAKADRLPIVALTAMAMDGDKEMLLSEGLDDYLSKPLTKKKLEYVLNKYLKVEAE
ncbi:MAG: response regulator [Sulfurimonas sp.]